MRLITFLLITIFFSSCKDDGVLLPKPRMYPKINFPNRSFSVFIEKDCPFQMEVPDYFKVIEDKDTRDQDKNQCWFDLHSSELNAYLHLSYLSINNRKHFDKLVVDNFEMVDKHNIKANYRDEVRISDSERDIHGLMFEIDGPVATPFQFFVTDSTSHFLRGSLYFKSQVNRDSIAPVYQYVKEDIANLLETLSWR